MKEVRIGTVGEKGWCDSVRHGIFVLYSTKNIIQIASSGKFLHSVGVNGVHMFVRVCVSFFLILLIPESQE